MTCLKDLPPSERPLERLRRGNLDELDNSELLALVATGSAGRRARDPLELGKELMARFASLQRLSEASVMELAALPGLGNVGACRLKAALELGRRCAAPRAAAKARFASAREIFEAYGPRLATRRQEIFMAVLLDRKRRLLRDLQLAEGSLFECILEPREVFAVIVREMPAAVVFLHNHPSGDPAPSEDDNRLTQRLVAAGSLLGIQVLDHLIIGHGRYYSYRESAELGLQGEPGLAREADADFFVAAEAPVFPDLWCSHALDFEGEGGGGTGNG